MVSGNLRTRCVVPTEAAKLDRERTACFAGELRTRILRSAILERAFVLASGAVFVRHSSDRSAVQREFGPTPSDTRDYRNDAMELGQHNKRMDSCTIRSSA